MLWISRQRDPVATLSQERCVLLKVWQIDSMFALHTLKHHFALTSKTQHNATIQLMN